ncbi:MAG: tetratricopeptide repeat protein [Desulfobacteraceae bacterium]|nr:tetratricopeptide repeat protein [Desulfobacteraceae bacterium]
MNKKLIQTKRLLNIRYDILICLFLLLTTLATYGSVRNHEFVNFDDNIYFDEYHVNEGFTLDGIKWAFSLDDKQGSYWHPLTWFSFMLSHALYGPNPGMHHSISLMIHIANILLLFIVLRRMTGALWKSAFVAALFALHPINVESVAWVTQRPNILSTLFWMLTMLVYSYYTNQPSIFRYLLVVLIFVFGLMAKPMLITLPFVLLLLDYWPLKRFKFPVSRKALLFPILEKIPLIVISMVSVFITIKSIGSVVSTEIVPAKLRIANALVSYAGYIWKMIWPHNLAIYYPYPSTIPVWKIAGAGFVLVCLSVLFIWRFRKQPYLAVGWLWFLGTLVPLIGLVQMGLQPALADRYAYVSFIGLFIILAWGIPDLLKGWRNNETGLGILSIAFLLTLMMTSWLQLGYWANSVTLFKRAADVTTNNYVAHNNLGFTLTAQGKCNDAIKHFKEALRIKPDFETANLNLGIALLAQGKIEKCIEYYEDVLREKPHYATVHNNLGALLLHKGEIDNAINHFREALSLKKNYAEAYNGLGMAMKIKGEINEAILLFQRALTIKPDYVKAQNNLAKTFYERNK